MTPEELEPKAEKALRFLHEEAGRHAEARAQADHMGDFLKYTKADLMTRISGNSAAEREASAMAHPDYKTALEGAKEARRLWYEVQFKREAASAFIGAWQTACANARKSV